MREEIEVRSFDRQNCVDDQGALSDKVIEEIYSFKLTEEDLKQVENENAKSDQNKDQDKAENFDEESGLLNFIDDIFQTPDEQIRKQLQQFPECSICMHKFKVGDELRMLPQCCHIFHVACIDSWFRVKGTCPMDRDDVNTNLKREIYPMYSNQLR